MTEGDSLLPNKKQIQLPWGWKVGGWVLASAAVTWAPDPLLTSAPPQAASSFFPQAAQILWASGYP